MAKAAKKEMEWGEQIRTAKVTAADMIKGLEAVNSLHGQEIDWEDRMFAIMKAFGFFKVGEKAYDNDEENNRMMNIASSVQFRLEALGPLISDSRFAPYITKGNGKDQPDGIHLAAIEAAAKATLLESVKDGTRLDAKEFFDVAKAAKTRLEQEQ